MINFWGVAANAVWIAGAALLLAMWSHARYEAGQRGVKMGTLFAEWGYALALDGGMMLVLAGLALSESRAWARWVWALLILALLAALGMRLFHQAAPEANHESA